MSKKILFVEDEKDFAQAVSSYLGRRGLTVSPVFTGKEGLRKMGQNPYDLVILDLSLPDEDGLSLCQKIREKKKVPVLILTARDEVKDKVSGLNAGADDYLVKPVSLKELLVRIERLLQREIKSTFRSAVFEFKGVKFDTADGILSAGRRAVPLTKRESAVLEFLLLRRGQVLSRMEIMDHVWGSEIDLLSNTVNMVISSLRRKLKKLSRQDFIRSVHGFGYKFEV